MMRLASSPKSTKWLGKEVGGEVSFGGGSLGRFPQLVERSFDIARLEGSFTPRRKENATRSDSRSGRMEMDGPYLHKICYTRPTHDIDGLERTRYRPLMHCERVSRMVQHLCSGLLGRRT